MIVAIYNDYKVLRRFSQNDQTAQHRKISVIKLATIIHALELWNLTAQIREAGSSEVLAAYAPDLDTNRETLPQIISC